MHAAEGAIPHTRSGPVLDPIHCRHWRAKRHLVSGRFHRRTGLRPATPSNVPYIGRTKIRNLYLNTGHGTLGWTHAAGSGRAIADIVSGRDVELDFAFTGLPD